MNSDMNLKEKQQKPEKIIVSGRWDWYSDVEDVKKEEHLNKEEIPLQRYNWWIE
jgi:hypothetical protein